MRRAGAGCLRGGEAEDTWPARASVDDVIYGVGGEWGLSRCMQRRETDGRHGSALISQRWQVSYR